VELRLERFERSRTRTLGKLYVDEQFQCYTCEDVVRVDDPATAQDESQKVWGETAIPAGRYKVVISYSPKFRKNLPLLLNVPGFDGIRIHSGNDEDDTHGCILVGLGLNNTSTGIVKSRVAMGNLQHKIRAALGRGEEVWITIE
jgi:hypothetical protein